MKYIRTKDEKIYEVLSKEEEWFVVDDYIDIDEPPCPNEPGPQ